MKHKSYTRKQARAKSNNGEPGLRLEIRGFLLKVESGQTDGKLTETPGQVIDEGKQKRSAREQAIFEATSKLSKKRDEAYFDTIEEAQTQVKLLPMLAHPFDKRKHNISYPSHR